MSAGWGLFCFLVLCVIVGIAANCGGTIWDHEPRGPERIDPYREAQKNIDSHFHAAQRKIEDMRRQ